MITAKEYTNQGITKHNDGDYKGAIVEFTNAIEIDSKYADAYFHRAITKDKLGESEKAEKDFDKAIIHYQNPLQKNIAKSYFHKGIINKNKKNSCEEEEMENLYEALKYLSVAIELHPSYSEAYYQRFLVNEDLGDLESAMDDYSSAKALGHNMKK